MATVQDITDLYGRIKRLHTRLADTSGDGFEWKVEVGEVIHSYHVSAMKSPKEIEDDIAALAVWLWSMKDYFQALLRSAGKDTMQVGLFVDTQSSLKLCSDIGFARCCTIFYPISFNGSNLWQVKRSQGF
jgi:hypothetical protein